jgi:nitrogen regulation protein NR(I)
MSRILVIDDEPSIRAAFVEVLSAEGHQVVDDDSAEQALARLAAEPIDLVITDICLPGMSGLEALEQIRRLEPKLPVIVMTGFGTMQTAIEATKRGAFDYHLKPLDPAALMVTVERALEAARLMRRQVAMGPESQVTASADAIIGRSEAMQRVYKTIGRVAPTEAAVLIRGESGTGKELVARAIYQHSSRSHRPLLVINCAAIPEMLLESELFGYERGAFTGAVARRVGKFEQADEGTVFLDEIADIPRGLQAKILRVLQEKTFERLGGNQTIQVDVRVLAATNRDLTKAIAEGEFREDLYHRLNVVSVWVPPLRERREDIPLLVAYFLKRFAVELGIANPFLAETALEPLGQHAWPGNVRELEHCIHRALIFARGHPIQAADLKSLLDADGPTPPPDERFDMRQLADCVRSFLEHAGSQRPLEALLETVERLLLAEALERSAGNQSQAARLLGLPRPTLHARLRKHGLQSDRPSSGG